jgi:hypothetical protein
MNVNKPKLKRLKIEHFAIIFLTLGIIVLYLLSIGSDPIFVENYSELDKYEGKIVITKGIVIDHDTTSRGETVLTLLEPQDLESTLKIFIESCSRDFTVGDVVQVKGSILRINDNFLELIVINEKDIKVTGHWYNYRLSIPELAHRLEQNPMEFKYLPVEVTGYIKYEPRMPLTSLRLTEHPTDGIYSVKVEISSFEQPEAELHKGDLVSIKVSMEYNENNFEYKLISKNLTLLESYGDWSISLSELTEAPFVFEGAKLNISGYIFEYKNYYNYIVILDTPTAWRSSANSSIWVDITGLNLTGVSLQEDYYVSISGILYYDPQYLDYALQAKQLTLE